MDPNILVWLFMQQYQHNSASSGGSAGALSYSQRALKIDEKVYGPDHPAVAVEA